MLGYARIEALEETGPVGKSHSSDIGDPSHEKSSSTR
ncbi:MAG: hypothetical protein RL623_671, partial [Actinomycetota bacterium]